MTPAEYVAKQTSASGVAGVSPLDPVTSAGESAAKSTAHWYGDHGQRTRRNAS
jgi:hypothetical protein